MILKITNKIFTLIAFGFSKLIHSNAVLRLYDPIENCQKYGKTIFGVNKNLGDVVLSQSPGITSERNCVVSQGRNAVYNLEGEVVERSRLIRGQLGRKINAPSHLGCNELDETEKLDVAIYGGVLFPNHYGHLITESTARLWPFLDPNEEFSDKEIPVLFRVAGRGAPETPITGTTQLLLESLGVYGRVKIVQKPTLVKKLIIPEAANSNAGHVFEVFRDLLKNTGERILNSTDGDTNNWLDQSIYLSRTRLSRQLRRIWNEEKLENGLRKKGFRIVHPQEMGIRDQVKMFSEAKEIVGPLGSAFHTMLFSQNQKMKLKYLVHDCPHDKFTTSRTYQIFDKLYDIDSSYIRCLYRHPLGLKDSRDVIVDTENALKAILD